jgi:lactoylglutathione lyase
MDSSVRVEHVAVWCSDIEKVRAFYVTWFGARSGERYENPAKGFASYFVALGEGARIEIMQRRDVTHPPQGGACGYAHVALALESEAAVDALTARMREAGVPVVDGPRRTGDGYYESVVLDPEGNRIELAAARDPSRRPIDAALADRYR